MKALLERVNLGENEEKVKAVNTIFRKSTIRSNKKQEIIIAKGELALNKYFLNEWMSE
jgi:hypothetical protein